MTKSKTKYKKGQLIKKYEFSQSLMYIIQAITNEKTHDIYAKLIEEANALMKTIKFKFKSTDYERAKYLKKYIYYPNTKIYLGVYVIVEQQVLNTLNGETSISYSTYSLRDDFVPVDQVRYNFKLPISSIKMNETEYANLEADAILTDYSEEIEKPNNSKKLKLT